MNDELKEAEAALAALENPPPGTPAPDQREIDIAAQKVIDLREAAGKAGA